MIRGIHHVALSTSNFDLMVRFYRDAFGFTPATDELRWANDARIDRTIGVSGSAARTVMLKAGNCYLEVFEYSAPAGRTDPPLAPQDRGYTHFCVDTTDIAAEYKRLAALGMRFAHAEPMDFGAIKAVYGYDPEGRIIEIQQCAEDLAFSMETLGTVKFG
jgi:glyoxylase I family protein